MNALTDLANGRSLDIIRMAAVPATRVRLSVVIPNYNTAEYVLAAVESVLAQTFRSLEVIVVDDGSSDNSIEKILSISDERLTCICQANRGLAGARNTGLLVARGEYIGFLDSDDIWFPEKASRHLECMERQPELGLTFSHSAYLDQYGSPTGQLLISKCRNPTARDLVRRNSVGNGSTFILRRACLEMSGGFNESIRSCEEWELCVRVAACTDFQIQLVPDVLTGYRIRPGSLSVSYDHFIANGELALAQFRHYVPGFSDLDARIGAAQNYRIASRKAFSNGQIRLSRTFLLRSLLNHPGSVFCDPRATAMALLHLISLFLPQRISMMGYRAALRIMKIYFSQAVCGHVVPKFPVPDGHP